MVAAVVKTNIAAEMMTIIAPEVMTNIAPEVIVIIPPVMTPPPLVMTMSLSVVASPLLFVMIAVPPKMMLTTVPGVGCLGHSGDDEDPPKKTRQDNFS